MLAKLIKCVLRLMLLFPITAFAHLISISATVPFPASVIPGSTHFATYTVTNISSRASVTITNESQFPAYSGLSIASSTCGGTLLPGNTCTILVQLTAPNTSQTLSTELKVRAKPTADGVQAPIQVMITPFITNSFAYVANNNINTVALCSINSSDGTFYDCNTAVTLTNTAGIGIFRNFLYVGTSTITSLQVCNINSTTGAISGCTATGNGFVIPFDISFNPTGNYAYVGDLSGNVFLCTINQTSGALTDCSSTVTGLTFPVSIAFTPQGNFAYISDAGTGRVSVCNVNAVTGALSSCTTTVNSISTPYGMTLNAAGTYAYIVSNTGTGSVYLCSVNPSTGNLNNCAITGSIFSDPAYITLSASGTQAYITSTGSNTVALCAVNSVTGALYNCSTTGNGLSQPIGIGLF